MCIDKKGIMCMVKNVRCVRLHDAYKSITTICTMCMVKSVQYAWIKVYNVYGEKCTICMVKSV